jgi:hypothetical protein
MTPTLSRPKPELRGLPVISLEADEQLTRAIALRCAAERELDELHRQRASLMAPRPVQTDTTAARLARFDALLRGEEPSDEQAADALPKLMKRIAETQDDLVTLRAGEARERERVSAAINTACAPVHQQAIDQIVDGLLTYNAGADAEWTLRDRMITADVRVVLRPIVLHQLGRLRDEYSNISLVFREIKEYGLLNAEYERRAIAAGWRP